MARLIKLFYPCNSAGKKRILDSVREVVAVHKDQFVFPIQLAVTKVSTIRKVL